MKPPLKVEKVLYEQGPSWNLVDSTGQRIAAYLDEDDAKRLAAAEAVVRRLKGNIEAWREVIDAGRPGKVVLDLLVDILGPYPKDAMMRPRRLTQS